MWYTVLAFNVFNIKLLQSQTCYRHYFVLVNDINFLSVVTDWMLDRDPQEEVFKAFRLFDDDDSGKISLRNLRRVARELGENMTDEELRAMIDEFDKDGDGESKCCADCNLWEKMKILGFFSLLTPPSLYPSQK